MYYFVPGTKFCTPIAPSFLTLVKKWAKIYPDFVWGSERVRNAAGKRRSGVRDDTTGQIIITSGIKTTGVLDGFMEAEEETGQH